MSRSLRPGAAAPAVMLFLLACNSTPIQRNPGFVPSPVVPVAINNDSVPAIPGFSSAIKRGLTLFLSGQAPLDSAARLVGPGDVGAQSRQAVGNLLRLVRSARGLPGDVLKLTFYVTDLTEADAQAVREAASQAFPEAPAPAITIVGVDRLPGDGMRVAVDGIAILRSEFPDRERAGVRPAAQVSY